MFSLTGDTKTIDISEAKFDDFRREKPENNNQSNGANNSKPKEKTYKDYQVGDYITIELTDETSNKAKSVREIGMGPGGFREFGDKNGNKFNKDNKPKID